MVPVLIVLILGLGLDICLGYIRPPWSSRDIAVPATLEAGDYIVRHEMIALHSAYAYPGIQVYPSCFQITLQRWKWMDRPRRVQRRNLHLAERLVLSGKNDIPVPL